MLSWHATDRPNKVLQGTTFLFQVAEGRGLPLFVGVRRCHGASEARRGLLTGRSTELATGTGIMAEGPTVAIRGGPRSRKVEGKARKWAMAGVWACRSRYDTCRPTRGKPPAWLLDGQQRSSKDGFQKHRSMREALGSSYRKRISACWSGSAGRWQRHWQRRRERRGCSGGQRPSQLRSRRHQRAAACVAKACVSRVVAPHAAAGRVHIAQVVVPCVPAAKVVAACDRSQRHGEGEPARGERMGQTHAPAHMLRKRLRRQEHVRLHD